MGCIHSWTSPSRSKVILASNCDLGPRDRTQFVAEARALAQLGHPNVVRVLDYEDHADQPFLVMEFIDGGTLAELISQSGRLASDRVASIGVQAARGLDAALSAGLIHRDVKPSNILVPKSGMIKLVDFGTALLLNGRTAKPTVDRPVGTLLYMAPEQYAGRNVDHRADIYALGATLYQALTGCPPFDGQTAAEVLILKARAAEDPSVLVPPAAVVPGVPAGLSAIIVEMLQAEPEDRPSRYSLLAERRLEFADATADLTAPPRRESGVTGVKDTKRAPSSITVPAGIAVGVDSWIRHGEDALARGDRPLAKRFLEAARARAPTDDRVWIGLGRAANTPADTTAILNEGLQHCPDSSAILAAIAEVAERRGVQTLSDLWPTTRPRGAGL